MPQEGDGALVKFTFLSLYEQLFLCEALENLADTEHVSIIGRGVHENVINVSFDIFSQHVPREVSDKILEH